MYKRSFTREILYRVGAYGTHALDLICGDAIGYWHVLEYPKAGGTWLSRMLSDYLRIPMIQHPMAPVAMAGVLHGHYRYSRRLNRVLYLYRDGRDTMVSFYFHRMRAYQSSANTPAIKRLRRRYDAAFGQGFDPNDSVRHLPRFIEVEMEHPMSVRLNWPDHIADWKQDNRPNVAYLSYEQLLEDPHATLSRCIGQFQDKPIDDDRLAESISHFSFQKMTGRKPGEESSTDFIRKGQSGDWLNHFSKEAADVFNQYAGQTMIDLGYETSLNWADNYKLKS